MYHGRFKNSHYEAGFHWGQMLKKHGIEISKQHTFVIRKKDKILQREVFLFTKNIIQKYWRK